MARITSASGQAYGAKVDGNNRLHTAAIVESESDRATELGEGFNINTGLVGLTSTTASGLIYLKNNEDRDLVVDFIVIGIDNAGTNASLPVWKVIKNPTVGTLISGAAAVDINENRNFGSSRELEALVYKGAEGSTVTDGDDTLLGFAEVGKRTEVRINMDLPKGNAMALTLDTQTTAGTTQVYVAVLCHIKDNNNQD